MHFSRIIITLAACIVLAGCASIIHEKKQPVKINTIPPGAHLTINGHSYITPATVPLEGKQEYYFTIDKPGYKSTSGKIDGHLRVWSAIVGNMPTLMLGAAVDLMETGAAYEMKKSNTITLEPVPAPPVAAYPAPAPGAASYPVAVPAPAYVTPGYGTTPPAALAPLP